MGQRRRNITRKQRRGYIYLRARGGINDNLVQLAICTKYAIQHKRSIIFETITYSASDLLTVFDFSAFPVPIFTDFKKRAHELASKPIEPDFIESLTEPMDYNTLKRDGWYNSEDRPLRFDLNKSYPQDTVLFYGCGGGGGGDEAVNLLSHIRLTPALKKVYQQGLKDYSIPEEYISIHLRSTDRKLNITNNITGILLNESNSIIKKPSSGNTHGDSLKKIYAFLEASPLPAFISGDNPKLIERISKKYPQVLRSHAVNVNKACAYNRNCPALHKLGKKDANNLRDAIIDLLILAGGKAIMTSAGGYSRLARKLLARPDIMDKLFS